jgi:hypothetical protein
MKLIVLGSFVLMLSCIDVHASEPFGNCVEPIRISLPISLSSDTVVAEDSLRRSTVGKWLVGSLHVAIGSGGYAATMFSLASPRYWDTTKANESTVAAALLSGAGCAVVTQLVGDYLLGGNGSLPATLAGGILGAYSIREAMETESIFLRRLLMIVPPSLGAFAGYWLSSSKKGLTLDLTPFYRDEKLGGAVRVEYRF